jgi:hypothetical protein
LYNQLQRSFIHSYNPYIQLVKKYQIHSKRQIEPISTEYLDSSSVIQEENIALLKNAIELWRSASQATDAIAPILFHYSWHCLNSFFAYSFFRWNPKHSQSHGINIGKINNDIGKIQITISNNGLFSRLIDAWTCLGASLAFSKYLPIMQEGMYDVKPNELYFLKESNTVELSTLMNFKPVEDYERKYWNDYGRTNLIQNTSFKNSMNIPTRIMQSYLILFVASSLARYRPILWALILSGNNNQNAHFSLQYRNALLMYTQFGINSISFLSQLSKLNNNLLHGKFELKPIP